MAARITGAIVAAIAAALLVWVIVISFGTESVVAPTVKVTERPSQQRETVGQGQQAPNKATPEQILAARTALMRDRSKAGPDVFPTLASGEFKLNMTPVGHADEAAVQKWSANKPSGDMLHQRGDISGISSLPYREAASFQQPQGRDWRRIHNDAVRYGGGWLIFGVLFALGFFLFVRGRVRVDEGFSGKPVKRFDAVERANHWMTATSFVLMAITGVIILYGKPLLIPIVGEAKFGPVAYWSAWLHMGLAVPFIIGIVIMLVSWVAENLPTWVDWEWLKQGGGMVVPGKHPPAYRFNAGQKILFWILTMGGILMVLSGVVLMFPFYWLGYIGMQSVQLLHAVLALCLIAVILGHIYIGTIGMEGAFDAMWEGDVDKNWAKEHHSIWYERVTRQAARPIKRDYATPAE